MMEDSFYLTLLSNSSIDYFPQNTTANFITKLPKTIELEGEWVVGLVEFHYPCAIFNVQERENNLYIKKKTIVEGDYEPNDEDSLISVEYISQIPAFTYDNINNLLKAFNENNLLHNNVRLQVDEKLKLVTVKKLNNNISSLILSPALNIQLGYEPYTNLIQKACAKYPFNLQLGLPSQLFIYSDIVHPQMVGDVMASLIRIIPLDVSKYIYGAYKMHILPHIHYLPIMRREFDTIEIDIRTGTGNKVPFQFGTACVKLHFRRIK